MFSGSDDKTVRLWDAATESELQCFSDHQVIVMLWNKFTLCLTYISTLITCIGICYWRWTENMSHDIQVTIFLLYLVIYDGKK